MRNGHAKTRLAAVRGSFEEVGSPHKVIYGFGDDADAMVEIRNYAQAAEVRQISRYSTYGSIGGAGMGIHTGIILLVRLGPVTLCRVSRIQGQHVMHIAPGKAFEPGAEVLTAGPLFA